MTVRRCASQLLLNTSALCSDHRARGVSACNRPFASAGAPHVHICSRNSVIHSPALLSLAARKARCKYHHNDQAFFVHEIDRNIMLLESLSNNVGRYQAKKYQQGTENMQPKACSASLLHTLGSRRPPNQPWRTRRKWKTAPRTSEKS